MKIEVPWTENIIITNPEKIGENFYKTNLLINAENRKISITFFSKTEKIFTTVKTETKEKPKKPQKQ